MNVDNLIEQLVEERSLEALEELTMSESDVVIEALVHAAGRLSQDEDLDESDDRIVDSIRQHIVGRKPVSVLMDALPNGDATTREFVLSCLSEIGDTKAVPAMITLLGDKNPDVREAAAEHLALLTHYDFGKDAAKWRDWYGRLVKGHEEQAQEEQEDKQRLLKMQMKGYRGKKGEGDDDEPMSDDDDDDRRRFGGDDDDDDRGRGRRFGGDDDDDDRGRVSSNDDDSW